MPTGMRGTKDFYRERFALGERLAVRLAALLAHKVDLTAAAIECLRESAPLQHVLLHPQLLDKASELTTGALRSLTLPGEELPADFVVAEAKGWKTIALAEELLAEQAEGQPQEAQLPALVPKGEVLHPGEIQELFTRRDIAELELVLRTSADPKEKVTALRRLALSPAGEREKMALFATALMDREAEVRSEAAQALTVLGLAPEVAEDARFLAEGNERQKHSAAQRIGRRFSQCRRGVSAPRDEELGVLLRIVAGTLRYEPSVEVRRLLIRAVEGACRAVAHDPQSCRDLVHVLLGQLRDAAELLGPEVRRVLLVLGECNPSDVYCVVQAELASLADPRARRPLVAAAVEFASSQEQRDEAMGQALDEFAASPDPAVECLPLINALARLGEAVVPRVAERLLAAPEAAQEAMVRLLDVVASREETSRAARARVGRIFLEALQRAQRAARLAVINSPATANPAIPAATRRGLAAELLATLQEYASPGILAAIEALVAKLGAPALPPLLELLANGERPASRVAAARTLGELASRLDARDAKAVAGAVGVVLAQLDGRFPDRRVLARTLGQMCSGVAADKATVERAADRLRSLILDKSLSHAALDGLGRLCLSPRAAPTLKVELLDFLGRLLGRELPEITVAATVPVAVGKRDACRYKDELVYALGEEVAAYTELVPGILTGLRNIALSSRGVVRQQALGHLVRAWRRIAQGELQLGPGNTDLLLGALHALGTLCDIEPAQREAIADAVALRRDYLPTYRVHAEILIAAGQAAAGRAASLAEELLKREATDRQLTPTEHGILLDALVRLAASDALGRAAGRLRERIVGAVADAFKREVERAADLVARLAESPAIPERLKKRLPSTG
ncbi:MAG: hypothetical protein FJ291_21430 [Planctomycetes bacterium]|nr:hypothetical protein [Planctomycetota bacterium]